MHPSTWGLPFAICECKRQLDITSFLVHSTASFCSGSYLSFLLTWASSKLGPFPCQLLSPAQSKVISLLLGYLYRAIGLVLVNRTDREFAGGLGKGSSLHKVFTGRDDPTMPLAIAMTGCDAQNCHSHFIAMRGTRFRMKLSPRAIE